jgi:hypothetical protein
MPSSSDGGQSAVGAWLDGWGRVLGAPAIVAGVFLLTLASALPLALVLRQSLQAHLGRSEMAIAAAEHVDYDWWQEFSAQATGVGATFTPAIIGFAATLDNVGSVLDGQAEPLAISLVLACYLAGWAFVTGGILDRYARQRRTRTHGFFAASGVYFVRFLRLAVLAGAFYWWLFDAVHPWLFDEVYPRLTRDFAVEREVFLVRLAMYAVFGLLLLFGNLVFDYAKIRAVAEDRRSMLGAIAAALRFITAHPGRAIGLYAANSAIFVVLLALWAAAAPGAGGDGASIWLGLLAGQTYVTARLLLKLHGLASQTALFQASLAHARYTAAPEPVWPDSPLAETIAARPPGARSIADTDHTR